MPDRSYLPLKKIAHRKRVDKIIDKGLSYPIMTVIAGTGYGKTMAVADCVKDTPAKLIWMKIGLADNEPERFWSHFLSAARVELPELVAELANEGFPTTFIAFGHFLRSFTAAAQVEERIILVMDDYQDLSCEPVHTFLADLLGAGIANVCLVLISNEKSNLNTLGMKHGLQLYSIGMEDLRFTDQEILAYFALYHIALAQEDIHVIASETEGWALALHFLRLQYEKTGSLFTSLTPMLLAAELFENEFFTTYDPSIQALLIELSFFSSFPVAFVRSFCQGDADRALDAIIHHMFIVYDYRHRMFTFQNMYRNFLTHKQALLPQGRVRALYTTGGKWFLAHQYYLEALECFWRTGDYDMLLQVLFSCSGARQSTAFMSYVLQRLHQVPEDYRKTDPRIDFCLGYFYLGLMETQTAGDIFQALCDALTARGDDTYAYLLGETHAVLGDISLLHNTTDFVEHYRLARQLLPGGSLVRNEQTFFVGNDECFFLHSNEPGALEAIKQMVFTAETSLLAFSNGCGQGYALLFAAECEFNTASLEKSREYCYQAIYKAQKYAQHDIVANAYFVLLRIDLAMGNYHPALDKLQKAETYIKQQKQKELLEIYDCMHAWFHIKLGSPDKSAAWIVQGRSDQFLELPIGQGRSRIICVFYLISKHRHSEALSVLVQTESILREKGLFTMRMVISLMKAVCYMETGVTDLALASFYDAYRQAWQNRVIMPFVQFGNAMRTMVRMAKADPAHSYDSAFLNLLSEESAAYAKKNAAMRKLHCKHAAVSSISLSPSELAILGYMAEGMTREEIASLMQISINTLKKRFTVIYTKLGAINGADAIRIASLRGELTMEEDE